MTKKVAKMHDSWNSWQHLRGKSLAMMVGNTVINEVFKKGFLANVRKNSKYFLFELKKLKKDFPSVIKEVRGIGLLIGLQLHVDLGKFIGSLTKISF